MTVAASREAALIRDLLRWYARSRRPMPWRAAPGRTAPAYHVLVSEAMLQQTQVATVIDYFHRFMHALPTVEDLAAADEQRVLRLWQGLGYYRRARHLHAAARTIVIEHHGRIPETPAELAKLPGVGRYTAGAIASMAFAQPAALVDGNVARVLARLLEITDRADTTTGRKQLWAEAEALIARVGRTRLRHDGRRLHAGDWNQALMELGATLCTPAKPACDRCPVRRHCRALATDRVAELPVVARRARQRPVVHHVLAIERRGRLLWQKRSSDGLWANMWQMPTVELEHSDANGHVQENAIEPPSLAGVAERFNLDLAKPSHVGGFVHLTTHKRIRFELWHIRCTAGRLPRDAGAWRPPHDLDDLPLPKPQQRALALLHAAK